MSTIDDMRKELIKLIRLREGLVGTDRRRTNQDINELQHKIDCAKRGDIAEITEDADLMKQIEEGKKDGVKVLDFEELAEELGI